MGFFCPSPICGSFVFPPIAMRHLLFFVDCELLANGLCASIFFSPPFFSWRTFQRLRRMGEYVGRGATASVL